MRSAGSIGVRGAPGGNETARAHADDRSARDLLRRRRSARRPGRPAAARLAGQPADLARGRGPAQRRRARTIVPALRGFAPTRFLRPGHPADRPDRRRWRRTRSTCSTASACDRVAVVGHDWGARAAYTLAALVPERCPGWWPSRSATTPGGGWCCRASSRPGSGGTSGSRPWTPAPRRVRQGPDRLRPAAVGHLEPDRLVRGRRVRRDRRGLRRTPTSSRSRCTATACAGAPPRATPRTTSSRPARRDGDPASRADAG